MHVQLLLPLVFLTRITASVAISLPGRDVFGTNLNHPEGHQLPFHVPGSHQTLDDDKISDTVYEVIKNDKRFSRLTKAIDFVDGIADLLNDPTAQLTFFAPYDKALHHPHNHSDLDIVSLSVPSESSLEELSSFPHPTSLSDALLWLDDLELSISQGDNPEDDKRKKFLKIIIRAILKYHIVPTGEYNITALGYNTTLPTSLVVPRVLDSQPLRLRIEKKVFPPITTINFYTKIIHPEMKATNGIIHVVNHPILPPPSVFQELYMVPRVFSTFTSAVQRSKLTEALDLRYHRGEGLKGASLVTVFAPINHAFDKLPHKLRLFLFSPFGEHVLQKLLQYHIVPDVLVYSDYVHRKHVEKRLPDLHACSASVGDVTDCASVVHGQLSKFPFHGISERELDGLDADSIHPQHPPHIDPISNVSLKLETLLTNHTLHVQIIKNNITFPFPGPKKPNKVDTKIFVNRRLVVVPDIVGLNGAIHVIPRILDPRVCHKHHGGHGHPHDEEYEEIDQYDDWKDWDKWLPRWAEEN